MHPPAPPSHKQSDRRMTRREAMAASTPSLLGVWRVSFPPQQGQDGRRVQAVLRHEYKCVWSLCRARESSRKLRGRTT